MGARQENSELEALQTDVMRFIAILGLCLAAIFSLVHSAAREHREVSVPLADVLPVAPVEVDPALRPATPAPVVETPRELQAPPEIETREGSKKEEASGFTLEFASGETLLSLLRKGDVKLYINSGEQYWTLDGRGSLLAAQAPSEFYLMAADTVPPVLRAAAPAEGTPVWGVTLSQAMRLAITELVDRHDHGNLVITASGKVILETR
jgi:hypothetical protein